MEYRKNDIIEVIPKGNVYSVYTPQQLAWVGLLDSSCIEIVLHKDLDFSINPWIPIEDFRGIFDGNGHTIKISKISDKSSGNGLFASVGWGGVVSNLCVEETVVINGGGLICDINNGYIFNCITKGMLIGGIGGICGSNNPGGKIEACINYANICNNIEGITIGGICGCNAEEALITGCSNYGNVGESGCVGGICGINEDGAIIKDCFNYGKITSSNTISGICGINEGEVRYSSNRGELYKF